MVQLAEEDIRTTEVLDWAGIHLLHARGSSCSQKVRIYLNLKKIPWTSHEIDLKSADNNGAWYLGINPRGLVPCLVHDGAVHIESNDIIEYLERQFPEPRLIPAKWGETIDEMLRHENDLHLDLRVLTFRYVIPTTSGQMKKGDALERLRRHNGTINGTPDPKLAQEIAFWESANTAGISDDQVAGSVERFRTALTKLEDVLRRSDYCIGTALSVVDIAWYVYVNRLLLAEYPLFDYHPSVMKWYRRMDAREAFHAEVRMPQHLAEAGAALRSQQARDGRDLKSVAKL